jgi:DNA repair protein RadD
MLRPYQIDLVNRARANFVRGLKSQIIQLSTGGGKTLLTASMIKSSLAKGKSALFIVHRRELVDQSAAAFTAQGIPHGIIASGYLENYNHKVQIASIQTLTRRLTRLRYEPDLIVFDECHHTAANNWAELFKHFSASFKIGLTATPCRLDGKGLSAFYEDIVSGPSMSELISGKFLSDYKLFAPSHIDVSGVKSQMGDYIRSELAQVVDTPKITGDVIREYKRRALGKRAVVFCINVEHSKHVTEQFNLANIPAEHIDGASDPDFRKQALARFRDGVTSVLCNVELFGEGFDLPSIECAILLRPTKSVSLYLQQVGRALRPAPGKDFAIIIDHVRNCQMHGLPDDERDWSLDGLNKKIKKNELAVKICPTCFAALRLTAKTCGECGNTIPSKRDDLDLQSLGTNDDLKEVDKKKFKSQGKDIDRARAKTKDELVKYAIEKGMKKPHAWAHYVFQARQRKKLQDR